MIPFASVDGGSTEGLATRHTAGRPCKQPRGRQRVSNAVCYVPAWPARLPAPNDDESCQALPQPHHWRNLFVSVCLVGFFWLVVWVVPVTRESRIRARGRCEPASRLCSVDGGVPERVLALRDRSRPIMLQVVRGGHYVASLDPSTHRVSFVADAPVPHGSFEGYLIVPLIGRPLFR
jgi:hypothetical protein